MKEQVGAGGEAMAAAMGTSMGSRGLSAWEEMRRGGCGCRSGAGLGKGAAGARGERVKTMSREICLPANRQTSAAGPCRAFLSASKCVAMGCVC